MALRHCSWNGCMQLVRQRRDCVHVVQNAGRKFYNGRRHRANTAAGDQDEVTGCVDEQGEVFRYPRVPFDFSLTSGVIKWDPFEGRQTIQIYGKFEGFPIV